MGVWVFFSVRRFIFFGSYAPLLPSVVGSFNSQTVRVLRRVGVLSCFVTSSEPLPTVNPEALLLSYSLSTLLRPF